MTTAPTAHKGAVGTAHTRVEGRDKVTGAARYAGEIPFAGLAHGWLVLSTVARGRIRSVETEPVLGMPGVLAVLTTRTPRASRPTTRASWASKPDPTTAVFQHDRVPHLGWPVALVVAETSEQAREAAEALVVHYEQEPHDVAFAAEHPDAYPAGAFGPAVIEKGDLEAELAASAVVLDAEYTTPEEHHNPMEPHAVTVRWDGGRLDVVDSNQGTLWVAGELANLFSPRPRLGAGALRACRRRLRQQGRPRAPGRRRRWPRPSSSARSGSVMTRRQMFSLGGLPQPHHPAGPARRRRRRTAARAGTPLPEPRPRPSTSSSSRRAGPARVMYDADAHHTANRVVRLDVPTPTWMRAPGEAPGSFALESAFDELAEKLGIDPIELRARNEPERGPVSGLPFSGRNLLACFREGARRFGWADRDPRPGVRRDGRWLLGTGTAAASFPARVPHRPRPP